jgi:hypothetical protein
MLTRTELETLAVMLHSAGRHMSSIRTPDGEWAWPSADGSFVTAHTEMVEGFYALQTDPYAEMVHIHA